MTVHNASATSFLSVCLIKHRHTAITFLSYIVTRIDQLNNIWSRIQFYEPLKSRAADPVHALPLSGLLALHFMFPLYLTRSWGNLYILKQVCSHLRQVMSILQSQFTLSCRQTTVIFNPTFCEKWARAASLFTLRVHVYLTRALPCCSRHLLTALNT